MPLNLSYAGYLEKNKLASDGVWLILLEINVPSLDETIYLVRNTENIEWNGSTWQAFPFELDDYNEDTSGEIPQLTLRVSNVKRQMEYYLEQADGGLGSTASIKVVHSNHLDATTPEIAFDFMVTGTSATSTWVTFILGVELPNIKQIGERVLKTFCRHDFKDARCKYSGEETECDHSLTRCKELNNASNFGGCPGVGSGGVYA